MFQGNELLDGMVIVLGIMSMSPRITSVKETGPASLRSTAQPLLNDVAMLIFTSVNGRP
jgi:hypothetical protein